MRTFSVELKSKSNLREFKLEEAHPEVSFYGILGALKSIKLVDDVVFEVAGENGFIRIDLTTIDFEKSGFYRRV